MVVSIVEEVERAVLVGGEGVTTKVSTAAVVAAIATA